MKKKEQKYNLVAPDIDYLTRCFERNGLLNPTHSTHTLLGSFEKIWSVLSVLAPIRDIDEVKTIWIRVPKGTIDDYGHRYYTYSEAKEYGEVETFEEYETQWNNEYPDDFVWYRVTAVKSFNQDKSLRYYGINLGNITIVSALTKNSNIEENYNYYEKFSITLCKLILPALQESVDLLKSGLYNNLVQSELPYQFRTGVIKRSELHAYDSSFKESDYDGLSSDMVQKFKNLIESGANDTNRIGRIQEFTANDFFRACRIGYQAIGKNCDGLTLSELYHQYSDGRDEGLTGMGYGLNEGPGIDFESSKAWNMWYFSNRGGGHPWEVVPGGNSTHMDLYVKNDKSFLDYSLRIGSITNSEYDSAIGHAGYYFEIVGMQRQFEAVSFYIALTDAGLPVIISGAEELLARFEATDYVGIVPHHIATRYCESLFPKEYGCIIDFIHTYKDEDPWFEKIAWLPEKSAKLNLG